MWCGSHWMDGDDVAVMFEPRILNPDKVCLPPEAPAVDRREDRLLGRQPLSAWPRVLAIDPGTHTGWAVIWFDPDQLFDVSKKSTRALVAWQAGMFLGDEDGQVDSVRWLLKREDVGGEGLAVVVESFRVRSINMAWEFLSPARIGGAIRYMCRKGVRSHDGVVRQRIVHWQEPSEALGAGGVSDATLHLNHIYLAGADHPRDATRHAFVWMRKLRSPGRGEAFYDASHFVDPE